MNGTAEAAFSLKRLTGLKFFGRSITRLSGNEPIGLLSMLNQKDLTPRRKDAKIPTTNFGER
jgi:hypothetical protein